MSSLESCVTGFHTSILEWSTESNSIQSFTFGVDILMGVLLNFCLYILSVSTYKAMDIHGIPLHDHISVFLCSSPPAL